MTVEACIVAGGHMADRGMPPTAQSMRGAELGMVRFNYRRTARKSGRLDDLFWLTETTSAVVHFARATLALATRIIGGRSMGDAVRTLCINGRRDTLCTPALMDRVPRAVTRSFTIQWVDGADHSFHVRKSSGRTDAWVVHELADVARRWVAGCTTISKLPRTRPSCGSAPRCVAPAASNADTDRCCAHRRRSVDEMLPTASWSPDRPAPV